MNSKDIQSVSDDKCPEIAYRKAQLRFTEQHPQSKKCYDEACKYLPGGNTRTVLHMSPFPLTISSAHSCYVKTIDGQQYVDFLGEYTAGIYGHNHPVIRRAVELALDRGWNYGGHSSNEARLAKLVCARFPAMELVRFVNSGTEANTMALATALAYTQKSKILIFQGAYHGGTITGHPVHGKRHINLPHDFVIGRYNDVEATKDILKAVPEGSLAAILVEPMLGSGGCFPARSEFLHFLRDAATQMEAILIFDEVMTSRLGYHGMGHQFGITPDLMTIGKWVGGGMTFGAFGGRMDLMSMYDPRKGDLSHPGTFNNNVFSMAAGVAGCNLLTEDMLNRLNEMGDSMRLTICQLLKQHGLSGNIPESPILGILQDSEPLPLMPRIFITGSGSLMNIHFGGPDRESLQGLFYHHMLDNGIYLAQRGFIALSIEIDQTHVDQFVKATDKFCQQWL